VTRPTGRRTALVTGASTGLGRGLAERLASDGAEVWLVARTAAALDEVARGIAARGGRAHPVVLDVGDTAATAARVRAIDEEAGGLDLVVANAGVGVADRDLPPYAWEAIAPALHVNLCGAAATLTAALPTMVARGRGHLVGISSLAALGALPDSAAYCAPKAGLSMLLECLRIDLAETGVAVTAVHLGFVRTRMVAESTHPMPQLLSVEEATARIVDALPSRPASIDLPQPLAAAARAFGRLPRPARDVVYRKLRAVTRR